MTVSRDQILAWLTKSAEVLLENKTYLTELDSAIGDADHGINMERGFKKVLAQLPGVAESDIGNILKTTGMALISSVGGAAGPLYGTFYMRAGMALSGKQELTEADIVAMLQAAVDGVVQRGKANLGDKTMVDALTPALVAFKETVEVQNGDMVAGMQKCRCSGRTRDERHDPDVGQKRPGQLPGRTEHRPPGPWRDFLVSDFESVARYNYVNLLT